jgi:hypothetical protein
LVGASLGLLLACSETTRVKVGMGGGGTAGSGQVGEVLARCGVGAIACGAAGGCCAAGNACTREGRCVPSSSCSTNADCGSDSTCGGSGCTAWSNYPASMNFDATCRNAVDLPSLRPEVRCRWGDTPPAQFPDSVQVIGTPMVVDFDFDDDPTTVQPSIVFISYAGSLADIDGVLRVIDGGDCSLQASIDGEEHPFLPDVSPALGDINGDGRPDIVAADITRNGTSTIHGVSAWTPAGTGTTFEPIARQTSSRTKRIAALSLHDVDGKSDDLPEILSNAGLFGFKDEMSGIPELVNIDGSALEPPIVHDVDGDRITELVTSEGIFSWNSLSDPPRMDTKLVRNAPLWTESKNIPSSFVGLANLGTFTTVGLAQDSVEMVVVSSGEIRVMQVDGSVLMRVVRSGFAGGPPVIADFDADGQMEFASPGLDQITVYDLDCLEGSQTVRAQNCKNPTGPNSSGILWTMLGTRGATSGASVFDFDSDGRAELVYADQCFMRIHDGLTGAVLFSVPRSSTTRWEYPVVADVDGDGHTEIVTSSNDSDSALQNCPVSDPLNSRERVAFAGTHGVTVWSDAQQKWAGSRPIWNQHTYSVSNVNDDGTIPPMDDVASQWNSPAADPNTLRQNVQGKSGASLALPDITVSADPVVRCLNNQALAKVSFALCNRGLAELPAGSAKVSLAAAATPESTLCTRSNAAPLLSGACETLSCDVNVPASNSGFDIAIRADSDNAVPECAEGQANTALLSNVFCSRLPE